TASYLKVTGTANFAAGANNELTITAFDDVANKATAYTGNKNLTFSGLAVIGVNNPTVEGVDFGTATVVAFTTGASNANAATLVAKKAETASVDVSDGTINSFGNTAYDLDVIVSPAVKNKLIFTGQPSSGPTPVNTAFAVQPIVAIHDTYGNTTADTDTVTLSSFSNSACIAVFTGLGGTLDKAAAAGVANFSANGVKFSTQAGSLYLKASSGALTTACTSPAVAVYAPSSGGRSFYVAPIAPIAPTAPTLTLLTLPYSAPTTVAEMQANLAVLQTNLLYLLQQLLVSLQAQLQALTR
ncbi:MAG: hypothetical protein Q8M92_09085, partial [Candidatus Subteraquimicrobiales bacterium]|nr:hypothetical protein [Candidatus Subteraquimicrobiales bacterium]